MSFSCRTITAHRENMIKDYISFTERLVGAQPSGTTDGAKPVESTPSTSRLDAASGPPASKPGNDEVKPKPG